MFYMIDESLTEVTREELRNTDKQYVAVLSADEWKRERDSFDMGIDMEPDVSEIYTTKAEVNYDSLTGTFSVPDRNDLSAQDRKFAFALDEKGIVFIDDSGLAQELINSIKGTKKWKFPSRRYSACAAVRESK